MESQHVNKSNAVYTERQPSSMTDDSKAKAQDTQIGLSAVDPSIREGSLMDSSQEKKKSWSFFRRKSNSGGHKDKHNKEKRESMSESGAFRIEMRNGVPIAVENRNWPPGVDYKESSVGKQLRGVDAGSGDPYANRGTIAPGGETAANIGPDPEWVPGLSEEERKKLKDDKSGRYGKLLSEHLTIHMHGANS